MEEVKEPENALESCLRLLKGKKDEQKIAGLLLASKHLKPSVCILKNGCNSLDTNTVESEAG